MGIVFEDYFDPKVIIHIADIDGYTFDLDLKQIEKIGRK